jgi:hypothetical protein
MRSSLFLSALCLMLGLAPASFAGPESYVQFAKGETASDAAMQTAVAHFSHPDKDVEVVLYGVVHIGDKAFYSRVQKDLDSYDKVLFEGVAPGKTAPTKEDNSLGEMQKMMGDMLGLSFQKDGIDYTRSNLVHADMNMDQLKEAMGGKTINPMGNMMGAEQMKKMAPMMKMMGGMAKMFMKGNSAMQDRFKIMMGQQMANADMSKAMGEQMSKAILIDRNKVCFDVLLEQLDVVKKGTIAIFYGAAHNPDLEERLNAIGYTRTSKRWMTAWKIGNGVGADTPALARTPQVPTVSTGKRKGPSATTTRVKPKAEPVPANGEPRWF